MRVLVTGSREFTDIGVVEHALTEVTSGQPRPHTLVHGAAQGADSLAAIVARRLGWIVESHPAAWEKHDDGCPDWHRGQRVCRRAGYRRNAEMVAAGAEVCVALFKRGAANRGTAGCVQLAGRAGIEIRRWSA